jgi:transcriptional regulator with XRE-family HTH domain
MQAKIPSDDNVDVRVRQRLRQLRMQRGLTLEDVANRSSIDVSTLSRLESGKRRLALDHLPRLATALSVSTDELLRAPEAGDPRVRGGSHTHHDVTYWPLTRHGPAGGLRAYKIRVNPRRRTPPAELPVHEGQDWIYVLSGRMRLILARRTSPSNPVKPWSFRRGPRTGSERWTDPSRRSRCSAHTVNGSTCITDFVLTDQPPRDAHPCNNLTLGGRPAAGQRPHRSLGG